MLDRPESYSCMRVFFFFFVGWCHPGPILANHGATLSANENKQSFKTLLSFSDTFNMRAKINIVFGVNVINLNYESSPLPVVCGTDAPSD